MPPRYRVRPPTASRLAIALLAASLVVPPPVLSGPLREWLQKRQDQRHQAAAPEARPLGAGMRIPGPGRYEIRLTHDGLARVYLVHVPRGYDVSRPAPLVMALHGGGGSRNWQADDTKYGLISKSEEAGFIAVFPNGVSRQSSGLLATWNAGGCCGQARDRNVDDVGFLRRVIEDVGRRAAVDRGRVYSIGMSNGALMSYRLACEAPDLLAGIMAVAGTDNTRQCSPRRPVPVLHIHARDDDRVLYNGGAGEKFRDETVVTDFVSVPATIGKWVALNRAVPEARRVLEVEGAWCERHDAREGGAPVQLCVTADGGHSWPGGGPSRGGEMPSQAIRANDVMWSFFASLR